MMRTTMTMMIMATVLMTTMIMMSKSGRSPGIILWHVPQAADQSDTQGAAACLSYMSLVPDIVIIIIVITTTTIITTITIIIIITDQTSWLLLPASLTNQTTSKTPQSFCLTHWSQLMTPLQNSTEYVWSAKHECFGCGWWVCSLTMGKLLPLCVHSMYTA